MIPESNLSFLRTIEVRFKLMKDFHGSRTMIDYIYPDDTTDYEVINAGSIKLY